MQINSTPAGAAVYLNGTATGDLTNATLADKPVGTYNVTVELDGYDPATEIVTLTKDETEDVSFTLMQQVGTLQVNSVPSGAAVYLNGTATGDLTNATLTDKPVGTYNVTVELDGYDPATEIVTLTKDETEDVSFTLMQQVGTLQVNSVPSGAAVYLNGTATGDLTNATLTDKPVGTYNVTVELDGYDPATEIVTLSKDETEDVSFTLVQQLGTLQINSTPAGASVYLNGTATGDLTNVTLADKPVGTYNVTVELDGYDPATEIVTLSKDETEEVAFTLVQQLGTLQINSTPSGAAVYLNGTATGDLTNATLADKPVGTYNVTVLKDGYDPATEIVTLSKDETEDVSFTLVQQLGILQINSTPWGAAVYLNGTATGDLTNVTLADKPVGTYNVTVELEGYDPATEIVTLSKDETEEVSFTLVQQLGTLQINSTPSGAAVYLNGTDTGDLTNATLADKPVGTYNVTVELNGYDPATEVVTLSKDETEDVSFTLVQQLGILQINSTPSGAAVYLNGTATGDLTNVTLADKPVGTYNVTVELDGYDPATEVVTLSKDETEEVAFTLVQQLGTLQINSTPSGAAVYLNGTATGDLTNATLTDKPVGTYNVTVELEGYDPATEIVTLSKDETEEVSFTLVQQLGTLQINSTPSGAAVYLNGTVTGDLTNATLADKPVGTYNVTVELVGYDPATEIVTLTKDETEDVSFTLVQQLGTLQINSTPAGASVYLNGTATGDLTNVTLADKPVGTYNVTVEKEGYDAQSRIVTLSKDETELVAFTLVGQTGTLQVNSTPTGARISLNGTETGEITNFTFADKPVGAYNVTVEKEGYDPATEIVTLSKDETEDVSFTLVQQLGILQINSTPSGAAVYLNGTATGDLTNATLADKPVGTYNVTVELDGYDPATEIVTLSKDETEEVSFTLVQQLGTLQINSTPSGAAVYLNGTATGDLTNATLEDKPVGTYNVTVELDGYDPATEIVTLSKDETEEVAFTLVQQLGTLQINSTPAGAAVYLNGTATGDLTNATLEDKPVGTYNVTVLKDGYDPATEVVTLTKDETEDVSFTLVQQLGTLQINSTPSGAAVYLNGTATGDLTNATLEDKPVGTYNVTVELNGYDPATEIVTLTKDETEDVSFTLVQQLGTLQINSTPVGAAVYLNGTATGDLTNATLADKPVGTYNVTVELDGYDPATEVVTLTKDETEEVSFTLVQQLGTLQINSTPAGAAVYLNGTATGDLTNATLADKPVGTYNVTVELDGYDPATEIVTLTKDETEDVSFTLVQQLGTLQINSTPSGAAVYLNGTATGDLTNATLEDKPVGTYNVTVELDGYDPATEVVTLTKDETEDVSFTLVQQLGTLQINSTPSGAAVYLNGTATGDLTNATLEDKPVGIYNVTVELNGYDPATEIVTLSKDETEDVSFTLVQQLGTLQINSTPAGAAVYLNGTDTGDLTNATLADKPVGTYNVTVEKEGYDAQSRIVTLSKDETELVAFTLVGQTGTLQVNSTPAGARISLNGTETGEITNFTFADQPVGAYNVTVEKEGYDAQSRIVTLSKDETELVAFTLVGQTGTLQVNSTPAGARISLNGTETGESTNFTFADQPVGTYNVTVEKEGYDAQSRIVTLSKDETELVAFTLVGQTGTLQVNSTPAGARISLNGTETGESTNFTFADQPVGTYNVTVEKEGYDAQSRIVTLSKDETELVAFTLVGQTGTLQVNSTPAGARISLNGTETGESTNFTFADQPVGTYNVTVEKEGYDAQSRIVTLSRDETELVDFTLVGQTGTLQVNSTPAGARISLNGTETGEITNFTFADQPVGTYNVTVEKEGYDAQSRIATVTVGTIETVDFTLISHPGAIRVGSSPANATIWLDGENTGQLTNTTLTGIAAGTHTVTVEKPGYLRPTNRSVTVVPDEESEVFFTLTQESGSIHVTSSPDEAWIWLDGCNTTALTNTTLPDIPVGSHTLTVEKAGYNPSSARSIEVATDETAEVSFTLTPVGTAPVAAFTATPLSGDAPLQVTFTDTSTDGPETWNWTFGDGNVSDERNPLHTYTEEGTYTVSLTVANGYGQDTLTREDYIVVSSTPAITLTAPTGRLPANESGEFPVTAEGLDATTALAFTIGYDPALITVDSAAPTPLTEAAVFDATIDNTNGRVSIAIADGSGITAEGTAAVANITFRSAPAIEGLRQTATLAITDATAHTADHESPVIRENGAIAVEARTAVDAPSGALPVESSKYLTVTAAGLNEVTDLSFIMEYNRTVMTVTDIRANATMPGLNVSSDIRNANGWLQVSAAAPDAITSEDVVSLIDLQVHSNGLPCERQLRLINPQWTRENATYQFDDMRPGYITITPVPTALNDTRPVTVSNMTFDDATQEVAINLTANRNATITDDNTTICVRNPGIDITIRTAGLENRSSEWTGECTGASIGNITNAVDLSGDVGAVTTGISANISGALSGLTDPDTRLNVTITRGAVNETMGRLFQLAVSESEGAELEEVAYTMEINKSKFGNITVSDAIIVMSASAAYVDAWGGADSFTILSLAADGTVTHLETTYTYADGIYTFTALSPDGFSYKALVAYTVYEDPVARFSATPLAGSAPLMVQFYDYSDGHPETWHWDFGDGQTSTQQNPVHTYTAVGTYDVALSITNPAGEDTAEEMDYITVTNLMTVDFTATPLSGSAPLMVRFTDRTTGTPTSWLWDFGDRQTSTEQNPVHIYQGSGPYTVSLTATNAYGTITAEKQRFITVSYPNDNDDSDMPTPTPTITPTPTPVQTTPAPTPEPTVTHPASTSVEGVEFITTADLPLGTGGEVERPVIVWADDHTACLSIEVGVTARDASGRPVDAIRIVAVPTTDLPAAAGIGAVEHPQAISAYECTPDGTTFSPDIALTFILSEDEWKKFGPSAEVGWLNTSSNEWERIAGEIDESQRTITVHIDHFSTYALFGDEQPYLTVVPEITGTSPDRSEGMSLWFGAVIIIVLIVAGVLYFRRRNEE
ncbi:PEGA domain-containing protein [Methanofollis fontis]|uniref:PEGA domain-containing protein n=1 Tax=Methanofollis fontis TaxID=2052832 RepID=UPI0026A16524